MNSPFPGMDPFLEDPLLWPDVRFELINITQATLNRQLRPMYFARIEDHTYISDDGYDLEIHEPDIRVKQVKSHQIVTVLNILAPSNKEANSIGRKGYLERRRDYLQSPWNLIEIDLLRAGEPIPFPTELPLSDYLIHVSRWQNRPTSEVWPIKLRQRLPVVPIPLRNGDPDASLDLRAILQQAYDRAGYDLTIDYSREPTPRPNPDDAAWLDQLLREKGLR